MSDDPPDPDATPTPAGRVCRLMRQAGIAEANPGHPDLLALIAAGATDAEFEHAAKVAVGRERGFAYALGVLKGQRTEAAKVTPLRAGKHAGFTAKDYRDGVAEDGSFS